MKQVLPGTLCLLVFVHSLLLFPAVLANREKLNPFINSKELSIIAPVVKPIYADPCSDRGQSLAAIGQRGVDCESPVQPIKIK